MTIAEMRDFDRTHDRNRESREYWRLFYVIYPLFLAEALVARMLPKRWRPQAGTASGKARGVFSEAAARAHTILPFVFMH